MCRHALMRSVRASWEGGADCAPRGDAGGRGSDPPVAASGRPVRRTARRMRHGRRRAGPALGGGGSSRGPGEELEQVRQGHDALPGRRPPAAARRAPRNSHRCRGGRAAARPSPRRERRPAGGSARRTGWERAAAVGRAVPRRHAPDMNRAGSPGNAPHTHARYPRQGAAEEASAHEHLAAPHLAQGGHGPRCHRQSRGSADDGIASPLVPSHPAPPTPIPH